MPKTSAIERNKKRIRLVAKYAKKHAELKAILKNPARTFAYGCRRQRGGTVASDALRP